MACMLVLAVLLSLAAWSAAFAQDEGTRAAGRTKVHKGANIPLSVSANQGTATPVTFSWKWYHKSKKPRDYHNLRTYTGKKGELSDSYLVRNYKDSDIAYYCEMTDASGQAIGAIYWEYEFAAKSTGKPDESESSKAKTDGTNQQRQSTKAVEISGGVLMKAGEFKKLKKKAVSVRGLVNASAKDGDVTLSWKKAKNTRKSKKKIGKIRYIQVQLASNRSFTKNAAGVKVRKNKTKLFLKLQTKKTWYFRIRYIGKKGVSRWSGVLSMKL